MRRQADCRPFLSNTSRRPHPFTSCIRKAGTSRRRSACFSTTPPERFVPSSGQIKRTPPINRWVLLACDGNYQGSSVSLPGLEGSAGLAGGGGQRHRLSGGNRRQVPARGIVEDTLVAGH